MIGSEWWRERVPERLGREYVDVVLDAIRNGRSILRWRKITVGDLEIRVMTKPLAIGNPDDHVLLYGLSAEAVDLIALELGEVMSPTPWLYDLVAQQPDVVWVGPHTLPTLLGVANGKEGMTKRAALAHSNAVQKQLQGHPVDVLAAGWGKTYALSRWRPEAPIRPKYALEYGWALQRPLSWASCNVSDTGWVVQPPQYAHSYAAFWDYSMAAWYVHAIAEYRGKRIDLRHWATDPVLASRISHNGPVPYIIHPDCPTPRDWADRCPDTEPSPGVVSWVAEQPQQIQLGSAGYWVEVWQRKLVTAGFSLFPYGADGHFGRLTEERTRQYQRGRGLTDDGVVGPETWHSAGGEESPPSEESRTGAPFPPIQDRATVFGTFPYRAAPQPGNPEAIKILGSWVRENIVAVTIPQLRGKIGAPKSGKIFFHRLGAHQLRNLFVAWEKAGLIDRIISWGGSWVPRFVRGSRVTLSNHAYGTAFDLNATWNTLGSVPARAGARGCVRELVPLAHEHGFFWGGNFPTRPDGMHFELAKVL